MGAGVGRAQLVLEIALAPGRRLLAGPDRLAESRCAFRWEAPCVTPAAKPETFCTGLVIAMLTARTAVSALSAMSTALSVT